MTVLITKQMNVGSKRQFVQSTYNDIAKQGEILLAKIQVKASLDGDNATKLRQKLLSIEVMRPFMTYDVLDLVDGTSRQQTMLSNHREHGEGASGNCEIQGSHQVYDPSLQPMNLRQHPSSKSSLAFMNFATNK